jgi:hypothetical protein
MFFPGSRYLNTGTYTFTTTSGTVVTATKLPLPQSGALLGYYQRLQGQRLDLIANSFLKDPTAFWQLCDANGSVVPDALLSRALIGIPAKGSSS